MPGFLRVIGFVVVGLLLVLVVAAVAVYAISESKLNRTLSVPTEAVAVPTDTTSIQRGQHLAASVATCIDCHGPTLGGKIFVDDPALGRVIAPNLTRGRGGVGGPPRAPGTAGRCSAARRRRRVCGCRTTLSFRTHLACPRKRTFPSSLGRGPCTPVAERIRSNRTRGASHRVARECS